MWQSAKKVSSCYSHLIPSIFTLLNTSIGVIALAMPYCFHECGILLAVTFLGIAALICVASCDIIIALCVSNNFIPFDLVCLQRLGHIGKLISELSGIGLLIGYIVGYNVSVVDMGEIIASNALSVRPTYGLRVVILILFTGAITPLCLIRRVQNFSQLSTFSMLFYALVLIHMTFALATPRLLSDPFCLGQINWWRPAGLPSCLPILFGAIFCQPQIPTVCASLRQPSVEAVRDVVRVSVTIVVITYGLFGFLGCVAFAGAKTLLGNVFLMYPDDLMSFTVQTGFLLTITVSIPLTLFPLRQSIYSFFFHNQQLPQLENEHGDSFNLPPRRFRLITLCILLVCFTFSLTTDKIEVIVNLTSSLAGSLIGFILPALVLLLTANSLQTQSPGLQAAKERRLTIVLLVLGFLLIFLGLLPTEHRAETVQFAPSNALVGQAGPGKAPNPIGPASGAAKPPAVAAADGQKVDTRALSRVARRFAAEKGSIDRPKSHVPLVKGPGAQRPGLGPPDSALDVDRKEIEQEKEEQVQANAQLAPPRLSDHKMVEAVRLTLTDVVGRQPPPAA